MGLSSSCWLCPHISNVWPHQNLSALSPLNTFRWKQLNHVCQQSSLNCQCQSAWLKNIQCSQSLQTCSCPLVLPLHNHSLTLASSVFSWQPLGMEVTQVSLNLCRIYWLSCIMGICMKLVGQGLPCFPHYTAFPGCSPIAWLHPNIVHQPIVHQIAYAPGPNTSAQVGTTWPSFCAQRLATLNETMCLSKLSIFIMSITKCNKRWAPQQWGIVWTGQYSHLIIVQCCVN
jgi:hypothetical protein